MKQGKIYLYNDFVGTLTEDENGFTFAYDLEYLSKPGAEATTLLHPTTCCLRHL